MSLGLFKIGGMPKEEVNTGKSMNPRARDWEIWVSLHAGSLVSFGYTRIDCVLTAQHLQKARARASFS
jgi:hypothetical protein